MPISNEKKWNEWVEINNDMYGKCCVDVAREVMKLLDTEKYKEIKSCHQIICQADNNIKTGGITGFMAGCVTVMVSKCHSRGEEFRKQWNEENGITEKEKKTNGVINPALLTIQLKEKKGG